MIRYFLIILLASISFLSAAQDVTIPADAARYFLEQDDRARILAKKDSINQRIISVVSQELEIKQAVINSYKQDSLTFRSIVSNKDQQISLTKEQLTLAQKTISTQKFEVNLLTGSTIGVVIGSVVPAIGTITGGVVGVLTGCVIYGVQKVKQLFKHK